jgi:hypothetical protein
MEKMLMAVFWAVTLRGVAGGYLPTGPHSVTTQKINTDLFIAVRTSNVMQSYTVRV